MSLRLISKGRRPIGFANGVAVYSISGAQPPEDDNSGDTGGDGGDSGDDGGTGGDESGDKPDDKPDTGTVSKEEYERVKARMQAADKNAAEALKKVKEFEDKDKSETEKLTGQVKDLTDANTALAEENKNLRFDNAFALQSKYSWEDPEIVLGLVRKSESVSVEEDGTIKGLDKALDEIAKSKPYLLKKSEQEGNPDEQPGPSGSSTGSGKKGDPKKVDAETLRKKYPALNI